MEKIYDTIIIGSGPAGITAGSYAVRREMKALVITKQFAVAVVQAMVSMGLQQYIII